MWDVGRMQVHFAIAFVSLTSPERTESQSVRTRDIRTEKDSAAGRPPLKS